jgi:hypothetical protein
VALASLLALLMVVGGFAAGGIPVALILLGFVAFVFALVGLIRGRLPGVVGRKRVGGVVAGAVVLMIVGAATAPPTPTDTTTAAAEQAAVEAAAREAAAEEKARELEAEESEEAAIKATEEALAAQDEQANDSSAAIPGALADDAVDQAVAQAAETTALAALVAIEVKGRAPRTGYDRDLFGSGWLDTDRNGCDTRNDILERDLTGETFKPGTRNCVVLTGTLADPYSGKTIAFQRGQDTSSDVQIDHVVALSDAWQKGAQQMSEDRRRLFANDPLNLLAVDGPLNMQKGDGDAATWLPPMRGYRCEYVARQVAVKATYALWMTQAEKNAIATVLSSCPAQPLPAGVVVDVPDRRPPPPPPPVVAPAPEDEAPVVVVPAPRPAPHVAPAPAPAPKPAPAPPPPPPPPAPAPAPSVSYANCDAVRAAGAAPIRPGDPGWQQKFDRDRDGIGCDT